MLPALIDKIDDWHSNPDKLRGVPTGFTDFDRKTGGLRGGDLVIVAGPSLDGQDHARHQHGRERGAGSAT